MRRFNLALKRIFDFLFSLIIILIISPLLIILAIIIKTTSRGPVLFKQERLGRHGKVFKIWKFRTMIPNAEQQGSGLFITEATDNRITKVGRFLRKTSLDELPQLFNVLSGKMSLVGPRPPVVYHPYDGYDNYPEEAKKRFDMRPGMTGLAQISVRNEAPWDERIKLDIEYVKTFNVWKDVKILFGTVKEVFHSKTF